MAQMIPERIPGASRGEQRVFSILRRLPHEDIVYYETLVRGRRPDFVVLSPVLGIVIIEVKGWRAANIIGGDCNEVTVEFSGQRQTKASPHQQLHRYFGAIRDVCMGHRDYRSITNARGLRYPIAKIAIFPMMTHQAMRTHHSGDLHLIFPHATTVCSDDLTVWDRLDADALREELRRYFNPTWPFEPMTAAQLAVLRAAIHPEVRIDQMSLPGAIEPDGPSIRVLDLEQERKAAGLGEGHRIIYGVPGSGKTVLLISRARMLRMANPKAQILVLCFNAILAVYLRAVLKDCSGLTILHFDAWAKLNECRRHSGEEDEPLGRRLLDVLRSGGRDTARFDAILVDEAQDFPPHWFRCILAAMKDPEDGDLLIVGDSAQSLRTKKRIVWKSLGIKAQGRTMNQRLGLDRNYRNTKSIVELASHFFVDTPEDSEDELGCMKMDPAAAVRGPGQPPVVVLCKDRNRECEVARAIVRRLTHGGRGFSFPRVFEPHEIGILYPRLENRNKPLFYAFLESLGKTTEFVWLSKGGDSRERLNTHGVKVQTIDSAKGLQYRAVIMLWADLLFEGRYDPSDDQRRLYVGLTRPQDFLAITTSDEAVFRRFSSGPLADSVNQWVDKGQKYEDFVRSPALEAIATETTTRG